MKSNFRLFWDGNQWAHQKIVHLKKGGDTWVSFRWFGKISHACQDLLEREAGALSETMAITEAFEKAAESVKEELRRVRALEFES